MTAHRIHDGVTLRMLTVGDHYFAALSQFAREFEADTGARVEIDRAKTWWHLHPRIAADVAAAEPRYDLFCNDVEFQYTIRQHLLPLNELLERRGRADDDFFAPIVRYSLAPPDEPGVRYGIPMRARVPLLFYRTDLMDAVPATWAEYDRVLADCAPAGGDGGFALGFAGGYNEQTTKLWIARYWALGDPLLAPDGRPLIAGEKGVEALAQLRRQAERFTPAGVPGWDHEYAGQMFREGRLAVLEGLAHPTLDGIEDPGVSAVSGRWSVGAYPGRGATVFTEPQLVIFRRTRHPEAAFDFIRHATQPAACRRVLAEHGEFTARRSTWREAARGEVAGPAPPAQLDLIAQNLDRGIPFLPWVPQWLEMLRSLWDGIAACLGGRLEPGAALAAVARDWTRAIEARPLEFPYRE
jgi:ABC-type glycerol-3-phosphate transport system substrate-binding protein